MRFDSVSDAELLRQLLYVQALVEQVPTHPAAAHWRRRLEQLRSERARRRAQAAAA